MDKKSLDGLSRFYQENLGQSLLFRKTFPWGKFFWTIFLFLILFVGGIYFFVISPEKKINGKGTELKIIAPPNIFAGEKFSYSISIFNQEKFILKNIELEVNFPDDFFLESSSPICSQVLTQRCLWRLPEILPAEQKEIKINGKIFGQSGGEKTIFAVLNFQLANLSSWFKKEATSKITIQPYPLEISPAGSKELMVGEEGEYRLKFKNQGSETVKIKIFLVPPSDFNLTFSDPEIERPEKLESISSQENFWLLELTPTEEKNLDFKGFFTRGEEGEKKIQIKTFLVSPIQKEFLQTEESFIISLLKLGLVIGLRINDSFEENQTGDLGTNLNFQLNYKNVGPEKIFDSVIKFKIDQSDFFDLTKLSHLFWQWLDGQKTLQGNQWKVETLLPEKYLLWNKDQIPALDVLDPGEEGEINFSFKVRSAEEMTRFRPTNVVLNFTWFVEANIFRQQTMVVKVTSNEINYRLQTKVRLTSEVRYYDDQGLVIGRGPLPPKVGQATYFVIFWRPVNTYNEIKNIRISSFLPAKIIWSDKIKTSLGRIFFDESQRKIIWEIENLSPYSGGGFSFVEASFEVALTPIFDDLGKLVPLLEKTFLEAEDNLTGGQIRTEADAVDSNLISDPWGKGKGIVE